MLTHSVTICIAGISTRISSINKEFLAECMEDYSNFIDRDAYPNIKIIVEVVSLEDLQGKTIHLSDENREVEPEVSYNKFNETFSFAWVNLFGEFNLGLMEGKLYCISKNTCVNSFLRFVYSIILPLNDGFFLHACSLIRNGNGYIFPGKSGTGKTTIASITKDSTLLTDELSLIKKVKGEFRIFGTPFWGSGVISGEKIDTSIKAIYFPKKDNKNYVENIKSLQALQQILPNIVFYGEEQGYTKKLFKHSSEFISKFPSYELHFLPEPSFWECIDAQ